MTDLNGILLINKPKNFTSRDVVNKVSHLLGTKKIGHTGTLDPLATGVLILTIGKCTKLTEMLTSEYKEYIAEFILGFETDTLDITGEKTKESSHMVTKDAIEEAIYSFKGEYNQVVPKYSAVKVNGKKLYEYARSGLPVNLPSRLVNIKNIEILSFDETKITIKTLVSKGTYIRSLIRDIGASLSTYATMMSLIRTKQGNFNIKNCYTLEEIEKNNFNILKPIQFLQNIRSIELDENLLKKVVNGIQLNYNFEDKFIKFVKANEVYAIYQKENNIYRMYVKLL